MDPIESIWQAREAAAREQGAAESATRLAELTRERDEAVVEQDRLRSVAFMACLDVQDTPMWNDLSERWKAATDRATTAEARIAELEAEVGRLRTAFRVNMLRLSPGVSHAEIDALLTKQG